MAIWGPRYDYRWWETGWAVLVMGLFAAGSAAGLDSGRRWWRFAGIASAAVALAIVVARSWDLIAMDEEHLVSPVSLAFLFAAGNLLFHIPGKPERRWLNWSVLSVLGVTTFALNSISRGGQHPPSVGEVESFSAGPLDVPGGLVVVPTPGHTSGHCAFLLPEVGVVLTGDALVNENILNNDTGPRLMPRIFSHDWQKAAASLDQLAPLDADVIVPGHGTTMRMPIKEAVQRARQRLNDAGWWDR